MLDIDIKEEKDDCFINVNFANVIMATLVIQLMCTSTVGFFFGE